MKKGILIVVTGAPCTGKTTMGKFLGERLGISHIAKDVYKELLFDNIGIADREFSKKLGRASFVLLYKTMDLLMKSGKPLVVEANFKPEFDSEKIKELMKKHGYQSIQILCSTEPDVLLTRFTARAQDDRHPGHSDDSLSPEEIATMLDASVHGYLDIDGERIDVNTTDLEAIDYEAILKQVEALTKETGL